MDRLNDPPALEGALWIESIGGDRVFIIDSFAEGFPGARERTKHSHARMADDGEEPRKNARVFDDIRSPREPGEGILDCIRRVVMISANFDAEAVDAVVIRADKNCERLVVASRGRYDLCGVLTHVVISLFATGHVEIPIIR